MSKSVKLTGEVNLKMDNATKTKEGCTVEQPLGRVCIDNGVARRKISFLKTEVLVNLQKLTTALQANKRFPLFSP